MKKVSVIGVFLCLLFCLAGCNPADDAQIVATTKPVYQFTSALCQGTSIEVDLLISENVSCLHDYSLQVSQMRKLESAKLVIINGAGFEDFLADILAEKKTILDSSANIELHCPTAHGHEDGHNHEIDPHIWLSIKNARKMTENIAAGLSVRYPQYQEQIAKNLVKLHVKFDELESLTKEASSLSSKDIITFHDGFSYFAESVGLHILRSIEEESGAEASAQELISIIEDVNQNHIPAIFTEVNGGTSAATIVQNETGARIYALDMCLSDRNYFEAMKYNILTIKEALE